MPRNANTQESLEREATSAPEVYRRLVEERRELSIQMQRLVAEFERVDREIRAARVRLVRDLDAP